MLEPMATSDRYTYRQIARLLTAPLIEAYRQMTRLQLSSLDLRRTGTKPSVPIRTRRHMQALFYHGNNSTVIPHLLPHITNASPNTFTYSTAAFSLSDAEIGI